MNFQVFTLAFACGGGFIWDGIFLSLWWLRIPSVNVQSYEALLPYAAVVVASLSYVFGLLAYEALIVSLRPCVLALEQIGGLDYGRVGQNMVPGSASVRKSASCIVDQRG